MLLNERVNAKLLQYKLKRLGIAVSLWEIFSLFEFVNLRLAKMAYEPQRYASDLLISALRGVDGLPLDYLASRSGLRPRSAVVAQLVGAGLLMPTPGKLALTALGMPVADSVVRSLIEALEPAS